MLLQFTINSYCDYSARLTVNFCALYMIHCSMLCSCRIYFATGKQWNFTFFYKIHLIYFRQALSHIIHIDIINEHYTTHHHKQNQWHDHYIKKTVYRVILQDAHQPSCHAMGSRVNINQIRMLWCCIYSFFFTVKGGDISLNVYKY